MKIPLKINCLLVIVLSVVWGKAQAVSDEVQVIADRAYELLVAKDYDAAFPLMREAAEMGDCVSKGNLGTMYYKGLGTKANYEQAYHWWSEAENDGCDKPIRQYLRELKFFKVNGINYMLNENEALTVTYTDRDVSRNYNGRTTVNIPEQVTHNGKSYPVTTIGTDAFSGCESLTSVSIPNTVTEIRGNAFRGCSALSSIELPNSLTKIGYSAFAWCTSFTSFSIPNSVTEIGNQAFMGCGGFTSMVIPESVKSIGIEAFSDCSSLSSIKVPLSVEVIRKDAFKNTPWYDNKPKGAVVAGAVMYKYKGEMGSRTHITLPDGIKGITDDAFRYCHGLSSISMPNTLVFIGKCAFENCDNLTELLIPSSVSMIYEGAFMGCKGLQSIKVDTNNKSYDSRNDCNAIIETATGSLVAGCNNTVIPEGVTKIGNYAFYGCSGFSEIIFPNSLTSIGKEAFWECKGLSSLTFGSSLTTIGSEAFGACKSLTSVDLPNSLTTIDHEAFRYCQGLTTLSIPNSVKEIGYDAFRDCPNLKEVRSYIVDVSKVKTPSGIFYVQPKFSCVLKVPRGTVAAYRQAYGWNYFDQIEEVD